MLNLTVDLQLKMGRGLNCTKTKLHVVTKLNVGTKFAQEQNCTREKMHDDNFVRVKFLQVSKKLKKKK